MIRNNIEYHHLKASYIGQNLNDLFHHLYMGWNQARPEGSSDSQGDEGPEPFRHEEGPGQKPYEKYRPS